MATNKNRVKKYIAESINLEDIYYESILSKTKTTTIRIGYVIFNDITTNLTFNSKPTIKAIIKKLDYSKTFRALDKNDAVNDGYESVDKLKNDLKKYYPDIEDDSPLTIITFLPL
ncbi:ASCH domain-containing protein [Mangrovivirga cuniculi]|uniref:ASCH domain-containing protein n=1 Tax=Mangrovivirga cuniculi TaxID=2715131 RepID=A0A4D7JSP6_9BACT|nr:ASCH domain-containing protein [Mangrovivirga cuniculi]QCK15712.1 hypothetical protein DCC35_13645 [Mangrovivirga cuniculi]